jgi:hypothetical protein
LGLPLPGSGPAPGRGLTTHSRRTRAARDRPSCLSTRRNTSHHRRTPDRRRGARRAPVLRSATCAVSPLIRRTLRSSSYQRRPDRTRRTSRAAPMAGCIAVTVPRAGNGCTTAGRKRQAQ